MTRRPATHGDPEERRRAVEVYLSGVGSDAVGEILEAEGWARRRGPTVLSWVRRAGHQVRPHSATAERRAEALRAMRGGAPAVDAAAVAGVSRASAIAWRRQAGIPVRRGETLRQRHRETMMAIPIRLDEHMRAGLDPVEAIAAAGIRSVGERRARTLTRAAIATADRDLGAACLVLLGWRPILAALYRTADADAVSVILLSWPRARAIQRAKPSRWPGVADVLRAARASHRSDREVADLLGIRADVARRILRGE